MEGRESEEESENVREREREWEWMRINKREYEGKILVWESISTNQQKLLFCDTSVSLLRTLEPGGAAITFSKWILLLPNCQWLAICKDPAELCQIYYA